jgi:hypothetical protein
MDTLWIPYGYPMDTLWIPYGYPMDKKYQKLRSKKTKK